jgi:uncharacterized protein with PIN domain
MATATPMFLADPTLGRLVTWLRLLGYDTVYARHSEAPELIRRARADGRILLTRNTHLARRRALPPHVLVTSDDFRAQLRQVLDLCVGDAPLDLLSRCVRCNARLAPIDRAAVCAQVPEYVGRTQSSFARCPQCARIYWPATHVERMRGELQRLGVRPA